MKLDVSDGDYDVYGVKECEAVLAVASKMPGIRASGMDFDPKLGHRYMARRCHGRHMEDPMSRIVRFPR